MDFITVHEQSVKVYCTLVQSSTDGLFGCNASEYAAYTAVYRDVRHG
ncbi:hypothetical protein M3629_19315 [Paenibacillus polysaccharolyticus]|nr:hypothetical protein [Paenibacillus polysaccharolyticus]